MGLRRKGREIVLQALYNLDFSRDETSDNEPLAPSVYKKILRDTLESNSIKDDSKISEFSEALLKTILENIDRVDELLLNHLDNWRVEDLAVLDRNLLRLAITEMVYLYTPTAIAINEALEIAKKYCSEGTGKLINGVLDMIAKEFDNPSTNDSSEENAED